VEAASAAGARSVLVPTSATRMAEVRAAPEVAPNLAAAVDLLIGAGIGPSRGAGIGPSRGAGQ